MALALREPLTGEQRAYVIWLLANCYDIDATIQKFKGKFRGVELTVMDIQANDPRRLEGAWLDYFNDERAAFYGAPNDKAFRMAIIRRIMVFEEGRGAPALALKAAELLAKEDAGFYTPKAATKLASEEKDGPATFTFELDRAAQD